MPLVTDVSAILGLVLDDDEARLAEAVISETADDGAVVPSIFWYEIRNALIVNERRGRIRPERSAFFLAALTDMAMEVEPLPAEGPVLDLARRYNLTVYDSAYLELASRRSLRLATADRRLSDAADRIGVPLFSISG